jgi:predicted secreted Zn-dependent protease
MLVSILNLIVLILGGGIWVGRVESKMAANDRDDERHHGDTSKHMPFEEKVATFVTRIEHDREITLLRARLVEDVAAIRSDQRAMETKIDKLLERSGGM